MFSLPFPNPDLADGFGSRGYYDAGRWVRRSSPHRGVDFPQPHGKAIPAIGDGTIALVEHSEALGWVTVVHHRVDGRDVFSGYCHQSDKPALRPDQAVKRGETVGHVGVQGKNGSQAAGEHLHLTASHELRGVFAGEVFDPVAFIRAHATDPRSVPAHPRTYTVKPGDYLIKIAPKVRVDWHRIAELNGLQAPYVIHPGEKLRLS